ncbi:MAG: hypothetical protein E7342_02595 [Clostridiales bacterium]|nr:hypothetical protein [Clostridiales bacterium]
MDEAKKKRLIVSGTITAVLLIVILLSIMVYGLVSIGVENKRHSELIEREAELKELNKEFENTIEERSKRWWIEQRARELGYFYNNDQKLN